MKQPTEFILIYSNGKVFPAGHEHHINQSSIPLDIKFIDEQINHVNGLSHLNAVAVWNIYPKNQNNGKEA